jgi:pimeloyl-ACP methyl ester carboxylesterase
VITAVADRLPERVARIVYLDAFVPSDGESTSDLIAPDRWAALEFDTVRSTISNSLSFRWLPRPTAGDCATLFSSNAGTYAIGDVAGSPEFTHISYDDYQILRANLLSNGNRSRRDRLVPYTMFIDPQLGRVGLTEQQARMQGRGIRVARIPMSYVPRAIEVGSLGAWSRS